jgi:hypothetical protein
MTCLLNDIACILLHQGCGTTLIQGSLLLLPPPHVTARLLLECHDLTVPSQKNTAAAVNVVSAFSFVYDQASASGRIAGMQSLKQSLGESRAPCSSKAGRKNGFTINALRSSVSCGQHQTPVSATATAKRLGQACLRASHPRKNACVVKSVLAESTANAVDGCPRGSHWQVIIVRTTSNLWQLVSRQAS